MDKRGLLVVRQKRFATNVAVEAKKRNNQAQKYFFESWREWMTANHNPTMANKLNKISMDKKTMGHKARLITLDIK